MKKNSTFTLTVFVSLFLVSACGGGSESPKEPKVVPPVPPTESGFTFEVIASGFTIPWAIEVIEENKYLFTERLGELYLYDNGEVSELTGIPESSTIKVSHLTYGGLMDVSLHPNFKDNNLVYIAYVSSAGIMAVAKFELIEDKVNNLSVIFESNAFSIGSRIAWQNDEHFFVTQGLGGHPLPILGAQDLTNDGGKIHRLKADGSIPKDNPIFQGFLLPSSIWSYGHRDPQGLYYDKINETLYSNEHGPKGGDELNIINRGENYGWPLFSYGLNYDDTPVSNMTEAEAQQSTTLPLKYWTSEFNIAPSSLTHIENSNLSVWNDSFVMGALAMQSIVSYNLNNEQTTVLVENIGRVRDIAQLPSGDIVVLIDKRSPSDIDKGRLVKISAK